MITPNADAMAGVTPTAAPEIVKPVAGTWARLRSGSPWLAAFPGAWVPVLAMLPRAVEGTRTGMAWDVDLPRCTVQQRHDLAQVLARAGKGDAAKILAGLEVNSAVAVGAWHLAFVEDFSGKKRCTWMEFASAKKGAS